MKPCILIVENEAVLYDGIYNALENNFFENSHKIFKYYRKSKYNIVR